MTLTSIEHAEIAKKDLDHAIELLNAGDHVGAQDAIHQAQKSIHECHLIVWHTVTSLEMKKKQTTEKQK